MFLGHTCWREGLKFAGPCGVPCAVCMNGICMDLVGPPWSVEIDVVLHHGELADLFYDLWRGKYYCTPVRSMILL